MLLIAIAAAAAPACTSPEPAEPPVVDQVSAPADHRAGDPADDSPTATRAASGRAGNVSDEHPRPPAGDRPMLIVFTGDFCTPCRVMKPWIDEVARARPSVAVARVNVDRPDSERLVTFFQVDSVPTLVFIEADGAIVARREGLMTRAELELALRDRGWTE